MAVTHRGEKACTSLARIGIACLVMEFLAEHPDQPEIVSKSLTVIQRVGACPTAKEFLCQTNAFDKLFALVVGFFDPTTSDGFIARLIFFLVTS